MQTSRQTSQLTWAESGAVEGDFERRVRAQSDGKEHLVFVAKIHQRAKRQAAGRGKLHGSGGDARLGAST